MEDEVAVPGPSYTPYLPLRIKDGGPKGLSTAAEKAFCSGCPGSWVSLGSRPTGISPLAASSLHTPNAVIRTVLLALLFSRQCSDAILSPDCSRLLFVCPAFSHQDGRQAHSSTEQNVGVLS